MDLLLVGRLGTNARLSAHLDGRQSRTTGTVHKNSLFFLLTALNNIAIAFVKADLKARFAGDGGSLRQA